MTRLFAVVALLSLLGGALSGCAAAMPTAAARADMCRAPESNAATLLGYYNPLYTAVLREAQLAAWSSSTDVSEEHTGGRAGAEVVARSVLGNPTLFGNAQELLTCSSGLSDLTRRQLSQIVYLAGDAPGSQPDLVRARSLAEARQSAILDGFVPCLERRADGTCAQPTNANGIDEVLIESRDLSARLRAWEAAKQVGVPLRPGILELRDLRNRVARAMGHADYFAYQVSSYGMTVDEMMALLDRLVLETKPLFDELQCWARHELAARYTPGTPPPALIPAHWIGNRWAQEWPGLAAGVDFDRLVEGRPPEWIVEQAERFYVSMGFEELPDSFWTASDLYPVAAGQTRQKNSHASAWHIDLEHDVRSLMSVEANWRWFQTTHHELGHIYYYLSYSRPDVPPLLREGANRGYHEGMGDLIALASGAESYLREIGLVTRATTEEEQTAILLDSALTGAIVFIPWSAGTMSHFERDLYAGLPESELNTRWWEHVARFQGVAPPSTRPADACDACTKTHIIDDPAQYYDYAISNVLVHQLHDHICRQIVHADPRNCNYYNRRDVGDFLRSIMSVGMTRDWREVLRDHTGRDLTATPMLEYYAPLLEVLRTRNRGRDCGGGTADSATAPAAAAAAPAR